MRIRTLILLTALAALAAVPSAFAKGASEAKIEGPGLDLPIVLTPQGDSEMGGKIGQLAREAGFFAAVFGQEPDPMLPGRPEGDLGPKYKVTYTMPGPNGGEDLISQDLYPYAGDGLVSYTKPGQPFFGTEETRGGWFQGPSTLKDMLVEAGLPATRPSGSSGDGGGFWDFDVLAVVLALAVAAVGAASLLVLRRRPRPTPAA